MIKVYGKETLLDDIDWQNDKMLANRKISGKYKWSDGTYKTYVGSYEKKFLEFADKVMNIDSKDIMALSKEYSKLKISTVLVRLFLDKRVLSDIAIGAIPLSNTNTTVCGSKQVFSEGARSIIVSL